MGLSEFTFRIILLFIPGIVTYIIVDNLTLHREFKIHQSLTFSLVLGFVCYMLYLPISSIVPEKVGLPAFSFDKVLTKSEVAINLNEVIVVTLLAILVGVVLLRMMKTIPKWLNLVSIIRGSLTVSLTRINGRWDNMGVDLWSLIGTKKQPL